MSDYVSGDRVRHDVYGLGTVQARQRRASKAFRATHPARVRVEWDRRGRTTTVLRSNLSHTTR